MGRIKTKLVKRFTLDMYSKHAADFKPDFEENKVLVGKYLEVDSRKLRNVIAGYVTRLVRARQA